jgi:hypothetical protein
MKRLQLRAPLSRQEVKIRRGSRNEKERMTPYERYYEGETICTRRESEAVFVAELGDAPGYTNRASEVAAAKSPIEQGPSEATTSANEEKLKTYEAMESEKPNRNEPALTLEEERARRWEVERLREQKEALRRRFNRRGSTPPPNPTVPQFRHDLQSEGWSSEYYDAVNESSDDDEETAVAKLALNWVKADVAQKPTACSATFAKGQTIYQCQTCGYDDDIDFCAACFRATDHDGHAIVKKKSDGDGRLCDCGHPGAVVRRVICGIHGTMEPREWSDDSA